MFAIFARPLTSILTGAEALAMLLSFQTRTSPEKAQFVLDFIQIKRRRISRRANAPNPSPIN